MILNFFAHGPKCGSVALLEFEVVTITLAYTNNLKTNSERYLPMSMFLYKALEMNSMVYISGHSCI